MITSLSSTKEVLFVEQPSDHFKANLYRTQWLMAHNALHDIVYSDADAPKRVQEYFEELSTAERVASSPA